MCGELDKLIFAKKLKNKDTRLLLNHAHRLIKRNTRKHIKDLKIHNCDIEEFDAFKALPGFNDKNISLHLSQSCVTSVTNDKTSRIIPMTGAISNFKYIVSKDESHCDSLNMLLLGLDSNIVSFDDVLDKVDIKSKTKFQEQTLDYKGKESIVASSPILLNNGNLVQDTYRMKYAPDGSLTEINGETRLIKAA